MPTGLLFEADELVAKFLFSRFFYGPMTYDRAIGLVSNDVLIGGILFQNYNGFNVDLSYYGSKTLSVGIIRCLARFALSTFNLARVTAHTSKRNKHLICSLQKIGFAIEGRQKRFYGQRDCNRNVAVRFVMFREQIETLARLEQKAA